MKLRHGTADFERFVGLIAAGEAERQWAGWRAVVVQVESCIWVANMIGQHGIKSGSDNSPIRYEAVEKCLAKLAIEALSYLIIC